MSFQQPIFYFMVRRLKQATIAMLGFVMLGLLAALLMGDGEIVTRVHFANWVQHNYALVRAFTDYGLYPFYAFFLVLLGTGIARRETWMKLVAQAYIFTQLVGAFATVRVLKMALGRSRPDATPLPGFESQWIGFTWDAKYHSFPSGHTADIVTSVVFMALIVRAPWAAALLLAYALAMALSRLALAKHYPTDAVVGAAIALAACYLVVRFWLNPRLERTPPFPVPVWWRAG